VPDDKSSATTLRLAPPSGSDRMKIFSWASSPSIGGCSLTPWLTTKECAVVQAQFKTTLRFHYVDDPVHGTATVIIPPILPEYRPRAERALLAHWRETKVDPRRRPSLRPRPAGNAASTGTPTGKSGPGGFTQNSLFSTSTRPPKEKRPEPRIVFAPAAYLKYMYMCHAKGGHTEVGGYGVHELVGRWNNVIYVREFVTARQRVDPGFCSLDTDHANELVTERCLADERFNPNQLLACWCHTHPGDSITPSSIDWNTFDEHDTADWAAMIILGKRGQLGAHIRQRGALSPAIKEVSVAVDWATLDRPGVAALLRPDDWAAEYARNVWPSAQQHHPDHRQKGTHDFRDRYVLDHGRTPPPAGADHDDDCGLIELTSDDSPGGGGGDDNEDVITLWEVQLDIAEAEDELDLAREVLRGASNPDDIRKAQEWLADIEETLRTLRGDEASLLARPETAGAGGAAAPPPATQALITFGAGEPAPLIRGMVDVHQSRPGPAAEHPPG
jgi:hypothetical protein